VKTNKICLKFTKIRMNFQLTNFFGEFYNSHNPKNEVEEIDPISLYEQWLYNIYTSRLFANNHEFGTAHG
jgi:hypothetical protein